ncbi:MAG: cytochrome c3 family protein [Saprospiraceae bacterium]|nr:cytochrome c3 family protein [Saprospiraceae bacterium]
MTGAHAAIAINCVVCHNGNYNNTPNTCVGCHSADYSSASNPNHQVNQFSTNCTDCHNNNAWSPSSFDHNIVYPLTGAHAAIASNCVVCHNGNYNNTPNTCAGCHQDDYNSTTNPNHVSNQFSINCTDCHSNNAWQPATFNHNTVYPLTGAHAAIASNCVVCHNGNYNNTPNTCAGCHQPDYNSATDPNHVTNQFSINCTDCHNNSAWEPSTFNHNNVYPLTGAHAAISNNCIILPHKW